MKKFQLAVVAISVLISFSCMGLREDNNSGSNSEFNSVPDSRSSTSSFLGDDTQTYEFKDAKTGLTVFSIDYPSSWKVLSKPTYKSDKDIPFFLYRIQGPDGLKAFNGPSNLFFSYSNPEVAQLSRMSGNKNLRPLVPMQQLIQQDIEPRMRVQGFTFIGTRELPTLESFFKQKVAENALAPSQSDFNVTVWENANGQKSLIVVRRINYTRQMGQYGTSNVWFYTIDQMIADDRVFEDMVAKTVKAQLNFRENLQWNNYRDQIVARRTQIAQWQSTRAHQNRMAQQRASFNAHQERMKTLNGIQDANHASFMNRNFGGGGTASNYSGGGQQDFLNMINEEETVYNPGDGQNYQILSGAKETWMDSDGNYINSDDLFYDPNADTNLNQGNWSKVWGDY